MFEYLAVGTLKKLLFFLYFVGMIWILFTGAPTVQVAPPEGMVEDESANGRNFFGNVMSSIRRSPSPSKLNVNSVQHAKVSPSNSHGGEYGGPQNSFRKMPDE